MLLFLVFALQLSNAQAQSNPFYGHNLNKIAETSDTVRWTFTGSIKMSDAELDTIDSLIVNMKKANGGLIPVAFKFNKPAPSVGRFSYGFNAAKVLLMTLNYYEVAFKFKNGSLSQFYSSSAP